MKPLLVFSKLSPSASRSDDLIVTLGSRRMLASALPSGKKRQPAASSSLLILIRAMASLLAIRFPIPPGLVKRHNGLADGCGAVFAAFLSSQRLACHYLFPLLVNILLINSNTLLVGGWGDLPKSRWSGEKIGAIRPSFSSSISSITHIASALAS